MLGTRLPRHPGVRGFLLYFLFIGAGYILIEVALIQKFVLFLGHPVYALSGGDLLDAGVERPGQLLPAGGCWGENEGRLIKALGAVALLAHPSLAIVVSTPADGRWCGCRCG